ncbi:hypothetical protein BH23ACT10_BH23ACT10_26240 [soil metagenome]
MMHMHGVRARELSTRTVGIALDRLVAVPIDVGKSAAMAMVVDFTGRRLAAPFAFGLDRSGTRRLAERVAGVVPADAALVRAGVEACGHYHRPLLAAGVLPGGWQLLELNPAWVAAQRRVNGSARTKTDPTDLVAIAELLLAGRGYEVPAVAESLIELTAWIAHRRRRMLVRRATKQQLLGQVDRCFPGLAANLWSTSLTPTASPSSAQPVTIRIGRASPRRRDQPRGQRHHAPSRPRPRRRPMAPTPRLAPLRRPATRARQTRRDHHLRARAPRQQDRLRHGPRRCRVRPRPLERRTGLTPPAWPTRGPSARLTGRKAGPDVVLAMTSGPACETYSQLDAGSHASAR